MTEYELTRLLLALVCLLGLAHGMGYAMERFRMPRVIGEIGAGVVLGPSLFGALAPDLHAYIFVSKFSQGELFAFIYWLGLIALMFTSGFHVQRRVDMQDTRLGIVMLVSATGLPFLVGWFVPDIFDLAPYLGDNATELSVRLVTAVAFSVTSIPVISKIFSDLGIIGTRFARIIIAVATIQDLLLWMALSVATEVATRSSDAPVAETTAQIAAITVVFVIMSLWLGPRLLGWTTDQRYNLVIKGSESGYLFIVCFSFAGLASLLSINVVFGALVGGMVVGAVNNARFDPVKTRITDISNALFVPLYFALVGYQIDFFTSFDPLFTLAFLFLSSLIETLCVVCGVFLVTRHGLTSLNSGIALNTRGGPGIVLASIALAAEIINEFAFTALVLVAILTSLVSGMWFRHIRDKGLPLMETNSGR